METRKIVAWAALQFPVCAKLLLFSSIILGAEELEELPRA